ncbi:MAG: DUF4252 domain-containing protein [Prolixibacteraceae bacterium]|nr:DUF4252 domain-containing protein [Prolixibacteraceae bacterium]
MYKVFVVAVMFGVAMNVSAQKPFRKLAENYRNQSGYFVSELGKRTIKLYLKEKEPAKDIRDVLENIEQLQVMSFSMNDVNRVPVFINDVYVSYGLSDYIPFKVDRSTFENRLVFLKESGNTFSDLLVVSSLMKDVTLVEIQGDIDLEKISMLKDVLQIDALDALSSIDEQTKQDELKRGNGPSHHIAPDIEIKPKSKKAPRDGFRFWLTAKNEKEKRQTVKLPGNSFLYNTEADGGIRIYEKSGIELINTHDHPALFINGYATQNGYATSLMRLNPNCIESIHVIKKTGEPGSDDVIQVDLNGDAEDIYTVCDGILYFGQNGYIQSVSIDDDCGPNLLIDCNEKPISEIMEIEPKNIKSIQLTTDPRNCSGKLQGEYVVLESKE